MDLNCPEAPTITVKDKMKEEIKNQCVIVLDKYFVGRTYESDKVNSWKNYALEEITNFLKTKYEGYGFCVCMFIIGKGNIRTNSTGLSRSKTDAYILYSVDNNKLFAELRIYFYKNQYLYYI